MLYTKKEIEIMRKIVSILLFIPAFLICLSCDDQFAAESHLGSTDRIICAEISPLFSENQADDANDNRIDDIQAYLFDEGVFVKAYNGVKRTERKYEFQFEALSGNLYIVANASLLPDFQSPAPGLSESQWQETLIHAASGTAESVYTGVISLSDYTASDHIIPVSLKRVAARFDLRIAVAGSAEVKNITFKQVLTEAYLFPQSEVVSPENCPATDIVLAPEQPYTGSESGILYLYEQQNPGLKVALNASIDGKEYSLETDLPKKISRNTVYSITLRKDAIDADVQLTVEEWKDGGDTTLKPGIDDRLTIDSTLTQLPPYATVVQEGRSARLSYCRTWQPTFIVAIKSDSELEVFPVADPSLSVRVPVSPHRVEKPRRQLRWLESTCSESVRNSTPPNMKTVDLKVYFHRKGLNNSYPEDHIQVSMTGNPTTSEGILNFGIDTYTHDFNRYIDNEFGVFTLPAEKEMLVEFEEGEDPWIRIDSESGSNTWRVLGGWRPNDPHGQTGGDNRPHS